MMIEQPPTCRPQHRKRTGLDLVAVASIMAAGLVWSFAGVFVHLAPHLDAWQFLLYRNLGIAVVFVILDRIRRGRSMTARFVALRWSGFIVTVCLSAASIGFIVAIKMTTFANAVFLSSCSPLLSSLIGYLVLGERLTRLQLAALALGLVGLGVIFHGDFNPGNLVGNLCALASACGFASSSVVMRRCPKLDFVPCVVFSGVLVSFFAGSICILDDTGSGTPLLEALVAFLAGFLVIGLGYSLFLRAAPRVPAVGQTLLAQTETVFGPAWVWLFFGEIPSDATLEGGIVILLAILLMASMPFRPLPSRC